MPFVIPPLPYKRNELAPHLSEQVVTTHYDIHTMRYFNKMNDLIADTILESSPTLLDAIEIARDFTFNNNAVLLDNMHQAWNHQFYWEGLCPASQGGTPSAELLKLINIEFDSFENFKKTFIDTGVKGFGSHWTWLIAHNTRLYIKNTPNANMPSIKTGFHPLFCLDGWEHAYYLQYPAEKAQYYEAVWNLLNWNRINERFTTET